jgi:hypothetical protein
MGELADLENPQNIKMRAVLVPKIITSLAVGNIRNELRRRLEAICRYD